MLETLIRIELGEYYMNDLGVVVRIRGEVDTDTIEYTHGARFFDSSCKLYNVYGQRVTTIGGIHAQGTLVREASTSEMTEYVLPTKVRVNINKRLANGSLIANTDSRFAMHPERIYFNRFGYPVRTESIIVDGKAKIGGFIHHADGRCFEHGTAMFDIIAMAL